MNKVNISRTSKAKAGDRSTASFQLGDSYKALNVTGPDNLFAETLEFYVAADKVNSHW